MKKPSAYLFTFPKPKPSYTTGRIKTVRKHLAFFVLLMILVIGFSFSFSINFSHAQATPSQSTQTIPTPQPMTVAQIKQISGWDNWDPNKPAPPGTKISDPISSGVLGEPATYMLVPGDSFTLTQSVGAPIAAAGNAIYDFATKAVLTVVIGVLSIIAGFLKTLVAYAAEVLDLTLNPALYSFTNNSMIVQGWTMVRDVCNLFFLLVLLFISLCTILKIEKYHAKKTLLTLIIMALLINFSKPIAIFIFDGSQLLMNEFLKQMGQTGTGQTTTTVVSAASNIANIVYNALPPNSGSTQIAIQYLFAVVFLFMLGVAFLVTALMLLIRIVAIMMLIIVSPLAFFAAIIPDFSKMSSKWWSSLFEYSYYGPAAAFFLLLATRLQNFLPPIRISDSSMSAIIIQMTQYLVVLIFLYASIIMAKQFGGGAGAAIVGNSNRFMKWAGGMSKGGGMWGSGARRISSAGAYKGTMSGIAQQPGWRVLTKEGRAEMSKERQEKYKRKVAPFSMADTRKEVKDKEFADQKRVDADIEKGASWAILLASKRGTLTDKQLENDSVKQMLSRSPELRKEVLGNLRDKGQSHMAAYLRSITREQESETGKQNWDLVQFGRDEINSNKKLGDMDWEKVTTFQNGTFRQVLADRLNNIANTNAQGFLNIASGLDGTKMEFIQNNSDFRDILTRAQETAGRNQGTGSRPSEGPRIETVRDYSPREKTTYDENGRPIT